MRLGLLYSRALFPFFHPTLPAHDSRDSRKQSLATLRCSPRRRSGLVPLYGVAPALFALSPLKMGAINA